MTEEELDEIVMSLTSEDILMHEGILRKSGRYPWGSGENPYQRSKSFKASVDELRKKGLTDSEICVGLGILNEQGKPSTTQLRAMTSIASAQIRAENISTAQKFKDKGMSNVAIGERMGINESQVRALLDPALKQRANETITIANMLKDEAAIKGYLDIGEGTENYVGVARSKLLTAAAVLKEEGYRVDRIKVQTGIGNETTVLVLSPPGTTYGDIMRNTDKIGTIAKYSEDGGRTFLGIEKPVDVDLKRVGVRYGDEGGSTMDGVIQLRRGVEDISLGNARYAQVRISVDGSHYLKGMAMYSDDLPKGVDMMFNTNKKNTGNKLDAMKPMKEDSINGGVDADNPFGATIRQKHYIDADGNRKLSPLNIVGTHKEDGTATSGEEGGWSTWSSTLSSQMMSKQTPTLAKRQLGIAYDKKQAEYDEIMALTNPVVRRKLLEKFSDGADSAATQLKAAGLKGTASHVILPINSLKDNEIFAPQYKDGDKVVLIRHPHGGIFEIPELTVNNRNKEANKVIPQARDAVGINSRVAERLSGADFDGDTVLVIPNPQSGPGRIKTAPPLDSLKGFDAKAQYPAYEGMKRMGQKGGGNTQTEMGNISNLITDMTVKEAPLREIARAVKHSMVVIDAEKHGLNYKQSAIDNNIKELKVKYQGSAVSGASTLISRASSEKRIDERKNRTVQNGGPIDKATGKRMYEDTGRSYTKKVVDPKTGAVTEKVVKNTTKVAKMALTDDAHTLSSGKVIESVYADHANRLKALANQARKEAISTPPVKLKPSAKAVYKPEVDSLMAKLNTARKNKPLERQAQLIANTQVTAKRQANPDMTKDQLKKIKQQAEQEARRRTGATKQAIQVTAAEWNAIQSGAVSSNVLNQILNNMNTDDIKKLATPREKTVMVPAKLARAKAMLAAGRTQAEIAEALGVPTSTLNDSLMT